MSKRKIGIVMFVFFLLAVVGLYLIFGGFSLYKNKDVNISTVQSEKERVLSLVKAGNQLSEPDKKLIFGIIKGNKINDFNFSSGELDLIMRALNK